MSTEQSEGETVARKKQRQYEEKENRKKYDEIVDKLIASGGIRHGGFHRFQLLPRELPYEKTSLSKSSHDEKNVVLNKSGPFQIKAEEEVTQQSSPTVEQLQRNSE